MTNLDLFLEKAGLTRLKDMAKHIKKYFSHSNEVSQDNCATISFNPLSREAVDYLENYVDSFICGDIMQYEPGHEKAFRELVERGFFVIEQKGISLDYFCEKIFKET